MMEFDIYNVLSKQDWRFCVIPGIWVSKYFGAKPTICIGFMWLFWGINIHFKKRA